MVNFGLEPTWTREEMEQGKSVAVMGYLGFLCILAWFVRKDNPFVKAHRGQQLLLAICFIIPLVNIIVIVCQIIGLVQTLQGNLWKVPVLYDWSRKLGW
ncbi:MAG: hypothetical protein GY771_03090 [bacterium]|nr:hypothetical protein [bacterium]